VTLFVGSRHSGTEARVDADGRRYLTPREPVGYLGRSDDVRHVVQQGDTLWNLAHRYFAGVDARPAGYWWAIADYQPHPIHDPTIQLVPGSVVVIPSLRTLTADILGGE